MLPGNLKTNNDWIKKVRSIFSDKFEVVSLDYASWPDLECTMKDLDFELDKLTKLIDEDEEVAEVTDRSYWEKRGTKATVSLVDELFEIIKTFDPSLELKYNKFYIGLAKNGQPNNFVVFRPKKKFVRIDLKIPREIDTENRIEEAGLLMHKDVRNVRKYDEDFYPLCVVASNEDFGIVCDNWYYRMDMEPQQEQNFKRTRSKY